MREDFSLLDLLTVCDAAARNGELASTERLRALARLASGVRALHPVKLALRHAEEVSAIIEADASATRKERAELLSELGAYIERCLALPEDGQDRDDDPKAPIPIDRGPRRPRLASAAVRTSDER
jgi:hypothetical protein